MKNHTERKGFTLIEALIAITVLVILAAVTVIESEELSASADASRIISNLNAIKKAAVSWYSNNPDTVREMFHSSKYIEDGSNASIRNEIARYVDGGLGIKLNEDSNKIKSGGYGIYRVKGYSSTWYVGYKFAPSENSIKEKLQGKAESLGLHFTKERPNPKGNDKNDNDGTNIVWMYALGPLTTTNW